jgi:putative ATPase
MADLFEAAGLTPPNPAPLAERLRPKSLGEVAGQDHLLSAEGPIGRMAAARRLSSMILWGPPGVGKTTIARLLAQAAGYEFQQISAVFAGVADLKKAFEQARVRRHAGQALASPERPGSRPAGGCHREARRHRDPGATANPSAPERRPAWP